jgi:hypothetical protein
LYYNVEFTLVLLGSLFNGQVSDESGSANVKVPEEFLETLDKSIVKKNCIPKHIFIWIKPS